MSEREKKLKSCILTSGSSLFFLNACEDALIFNTKPFNDPKFKDAMGYVIEKLKGYTNHFLVNDEDITLTAHDFIEEEFGGLYKTLLNTIKIEEKS